MSWGFGKFGCYTAMDAEQQRKLFVGGIPRHVNEIMLKNHFSQYGVVEECVIVLDRITRQPREFGFVTFTDPLVAERVLEENHSIFGTKIDVNPSEPRCERTWKNQGQKVPHHPKRIFVGGLPHHLTEEEFINYFAKFGAIDDGVIKYDEETNMPKGFGFITFESEEAVEDVLQKSFHEVKNKMVEVRRARVVVRRNHRRSTLVNWYGGEVIQMDDLAFGVNCLFCCNCGGAYGYGHYSGCLYGEDPYNGAWNIRRVLHAWNGYLESNEDLLTYVNPEASYSYE